MSQLTPSRPFAAFKAKDMRMFAVGAIHCGKGKKNDLTTSEPQGHHFFSKPLIRRHCRWCYVQSDCSAAQWLLSKLERHMIHLLIFSVGLRGPGACHALCFISSFNTRIGYDLRGGRYYKSPVRLFRPDSCSDLVDRCLHCKVGQAGSCIPTRETVGSRLGDLASTFRDHRVNSNISIEPFEDQAIKPVCTLHWHSWQTTFLTLDVKPLVFAVPSDRVTPCAPGGGESTAKLHYASTCIVLEDLSKGVKRLLGPSQWPKSAVIVETRETRKHKKTSTTTTVSHFHSNSTDLHVRYISSDQPPVNTAWFWCLCYMLQQFR